MLGFLFSLFISSHSGIDLYYDLNKSLPYTFRALLMNICRCIYIFFSSRHLLAYFLIDKQKVLSQFVWVVGKNVRFSHIYNIHILYISVFLTYRHRMIPLESKHFSFIIVSCLFYILKIHLDGRIVLFKSICKIYPWYKNCKTKPNLYIHIEHFTQKN